jgi:prepilin signal peptidase PulO-like enzyme (type II secretory pathway)
MVNIKGAWKGIEILVPNRHSKDKDSLFTYLGFVFIPLVVFSIISMLSPLEKSREGNIWYIVLYTGVILFGIIWMFSLIYKLIGKAHIYIKDNTLIIKKQMYDFGINFKYKIHKISNLYMENKFGGEYGYWIKFDYKGESYMLAEFLKETEAKSIITELQKHIDISRGI